MSCARRPAQSARAQGVLRPQSVHRSWRICGRAGTDLLAALDRLPQLLCHHDAFRRNLFLRSGRLLAVDWAFLGVGPLGSELAPLISASAASSSGSIVGDGMHLERAAVDAYIQGLADVGLHAPPKQTRFGFAALVGVAATLATWAVRLVIPTLIDEATAPAEQRRCIGIPFDQIVDLWADFAVRHSRLAAGALTTVPHAP